MPSENIKICSNGHIINYESEPGESFCRDCGAPLITFCPSCGATLPKRTYCIEYDYNDEPFSRFVADDLKDFLKDFACEVVLHKLGL